MSEIKTIEVNGITLAYKEFGSGDRYLLCSQNFFLSGCHEELLAKAPYDYHTFLVYMRGYGRSSHIFDTGLQDWVSVWGEDLIAFAEAMHIPSFYYTGVSHGNWAGWYIAFHRPEMIRAFVCCDGIVQYRENDGKSVVPALFDPEEFVGNYEKLEKMSWMEYWPTENPQRLKKREANHKEHTEILMGRSVEEFTIRNSEMTACNAHSEKELYEKLGKITFPVLIWVGGLDPLARPEKCLEVAQAIPGASLLTYQHLGHGGADECPEIAARDCDRFFRDTEGRIL